MIDLVKLRNKLPSTYRKEIAKREGVHPETVYKVISNRLNSPRILAALVKLAEENKEFNTDLEQRANNL